MDKKEAEKEIERLRKEINIHNYKYYIENNPILSDYEFDQLLKKLERLESKYPDLITPDSPTQRASCSPSYASAQYHPYAFEQEYEYHPRI